jgi:hypothetical protein
VGVVWELRRGAKAKKQRGDQLVAPCSEDVDFQGVRFIVWSIVLLNKWQQVVAHDPTAVERFLRAVGCESVDDAQTEPLMSGEVKLLRQREF